ncbi:ATP-binding protein [Herpetosiphon llansteffanensis]
MFVNLRRRLKSRIRYKITLPYLLLLAFLSGLLIVIIFWLYAQSLQNQLNQSLRTSATNTGVGLETIEAQILDNLRLLVTSPANEKEDLLSTAEAFSKNDVDQVEKIVNNAFNYFKPSRLIALNADGQVLVDAASSTVLSRSPSLVGSTELAKDSLIQAVLRGQVDDYGDKYASLLRIGTNPPYTMFFVVAPVKLTVGSSEQVVGAIIYAEPLERIVNEELPLRNGATITAILNSDGSVLTSNPPQEADELVINANQIEQIKASQANPDPETRGTLFTTIQRGDTSYQVMYSPMRIRRALNGYFAVGLPRSNIDRAWQQARVLIFLFGILSLISIIWISVRVTRSITVPLGELVTTALRIKSGDLEGRSFVSEENELGTLATVLNDMTDRLLDLYRTSRQLGTELTLDGVLTQTTAAVQRLIPEAEVDALVVEQGVWHYVTTETVREIARPFPATSLETLAPMVTIIENPALDSALRPLAPNVQLVLPLRTQQQVIGALLVKNDHAMPAASSIREPLSAIASMTATAMQNAVLYTTVQDEASRKQAILQSIADGVIVLDPDGKVILVNHTATAMLGASEADLLGKSFAEFSLTPLSGGAELFATPTATTFYETSDQRILTVNAAPVEREGLQSGEVLVLHDVTEERAMDRAKTDFIATISHELRTPLTSICGYADLLLRGFVGPLTDEQTQFMTTIRQQGQSMVEVLQNVIVIASIEAGNMEPQIEQHVLTELLPPIAQAFQKGFEQKQLKLLIDIPENMPYIVVDRDHFKIMLTQLLENARRYTQTGTVTVQAKTVDQRIQIAVIDTGPGIASQDYERLFERFQRGGEQSGLTSKERGIGLGLAITKQLVERNNGKIWVDSTQGVGSSFIMQFPMLQLEPSNYDLMKATVANS